MKSIKFFLVISLLLGIIIPVTGMDGNLDYSQEGTIQEIDKKIEAPETTSLDPIKDYSMILKDQINSMNLQRAEGNDKESSLQSQLMSTTDQYYVGDTETFWTQDTWKAYNGIDDDGDGRIDFTNGDWDEAMEEITAECKLVMDHVYIFVDQEEGSSYDSYLNALGNEYDNNIFPLEQHYFGDFPDIDNNERVILLIFDIKDASYHVGGSNYIVGYFWPLHTYNPAGYGPDDLQYYSEYKEIIHLDVLAFSQNIAAATAAHETQHLIHYENDPYESYWMDEGAATFAEYLCGYEGGLEDYIESASNSGYFDNPESSLTYWQQDLRSYGHAFLFTTYISQHYGGADTIQEIVQSHYHDMESVIRVLMNLGYEITAKELYLEWALTNIINDSSFDGNYHYPNSNLFNGKRVDYSVSYSSYPLEGEESVEYWGAHYIKLPNAQGTGEVEISTTSSDSQVAAATVVFRGESIDIEKIFLQDGQGKLIYDYDSSSEEAALVLVSVDGTSSGTEIVDTVPKQSISYSVDSLDLIGAPGNVSYSPSGTHIRIKNVQVRDINGTLLENDDFQQTAFALINAYTLEIALNGNLEWYIDNKTWNSQYIDITSLPKEFYRFEYYFESSTRNFSFQSEIFGVGKFYIEYGDVVYNIKEQYFQVKSIKAGENPVSLWTAENTEFANFTLWEYVGLGDYEKITSNDLIWESGFWRTPKIITLGLNNGSYILSYTFSSNGETYTFNSKVIVLDQNKPDPKAPQDTTGFSFLIYLFGFVFVVVLFRKRK